MQLSRVTPTDLRKNVYKILESVNQKQPIQIAGRKAHQSAILISTADYQRLKNYEVKFDATPLDVWYQKLSMLDAVNSDTVFYSIGQGAIMSTFQQLTPNQDMPFLNMGVKLLACLSCYVLRADGEQLTQTNLKKMAQLSFNQLIKKAQSIVPRNSPSQNLYTDTVDSLIQTLKALASSDKPQTNIMLCYRLML